jgi:hypothetical protein
MHRTWKIKALVPFPLEQVAPMDSITGGLPQQLKWESRVLEVTKIFNDLEVSIKKVDTPEHWQPSHYGMITESVEIQILVSEMDAHSALEKVDLLLEDICDNLSFRLQMALPIYQLEVVDITKPIELGEEREILLFPYPNGYKHSKFGSTVYMNTTSTELRPELRVDFLNLSDRDRAVMRWYQKSIAATSESDRFIFLMICLEILCEEYTEQVKAPYKTKCGHDIYNCPECGESIELVVNGPTLKKFLVEKLGMEEKIARDTWRLRQMVHGANDLSYKKMKGIPEVCRSLMCCVALGIKQKLAISPNEPPFFGIDGPGISTQFSLMGRRAINETDL